MFLCTVWCGIALLVNHGLGSVTRSVMICVEIFGGYLFGRVLIRNTADYRRFFDAPDHRLHAPRCPSRWSSS